MYKKLSYAITTLSILFTVTACDTWFGEKRSSFLNGKRVSVIAHKQETKVKKSIHIILPEAHYNSDWPQTGGNSQHTMQHLEANPRIFQVFGSVGSTYLSPYKYTLASPVLADGKIYVVNEKATISVFDIQSGRILWKKDLLPKGEEATPMSIGGLAYENGLLFITTSWGTVIAIQASTGYEVWHSFVGSPIRAAPTLNNKKVFIVNKNNEVRALKADSGTELWRWCGLADTTTLLGGAAPAVDNDIVIAALTSGELIALRADNGKQVWSITLASQIDDYIGAISNLADIIASPVVNRGRVYAISNSGIMTAIDIHSGRQLWELELPSAQQPWVSGSFLFTLTKDGSLVAIETQEGHIAWITELPKLVNPSDLKDHIYWTGPVLVGNHLVVVSSHYRVMFLSPYTGLLVDEDILPEKVTTSPIVAGKVLYLLTNSGTIISYK